MTSSGISIEDIPESYQDYIIAIYRLFAESEKVTNKDIADFMDIAPSSVYNMLKKLASRGLVEWEPKKKVIKLSPDGKEYGKRLILGHLIMELFLREYLGLTDDIQIHLLACQLEHHVTDSLREGFRKKIGETEYKKLESIVETDSDPEAAAKKIHEIFPSPHQIITQFTEKLIKLLPDSKGLIDSAKNEFIKKF